MNPVEREAKWQKFQKELKRTCNAGVPWFRVKPGEKKAARQTALYEPCPCGSGKKLKFCCKEVKP